MNTSPKLNPLTSVQIEAFASRPGAKRIAVENFLMTVHNNTDEHEAFVNARLDASSYGWNSATLGAIIDGIAQASKGQR